jgi:hypothetical protein
VRTRSLSWTNGVRPPSGGSAPACAATNRRLATHPSCRASAGRIASRTSGACWSRSVRSGASSTTAASRLKKTANAAEQEHPVVKARGLAWFEAQREFDPSRPVFVGETGPSPTCSTSPRRLLLAGPWRANGWRTSPPPAAPPRSLQTAAASPGSTCPRPIPKPRRRCWPSTSRSRGSHLAGLWRRAPVRPHPSSG